MIYTNERIGSPVDFVADIGVRDDMEIKGYEIVSGADFDVLVRPQTQEAVGHIETAVNPVLGRLYVHGQALGVRIGKQVLNIDWYPSPPACNQLSEDLDREPGVDVMRFVHAPHDKIPPDPYKAYVQSVEYPQSTGPDYFGHDRTNGHPTGVILAPTELAKSVKTMKGEGRRTLVDYFDGGTVAVTSLFRELHEGKDLKDSWSYNSFYLEGLLQMPSRKKGFFRGYSHEPVLELIQATYDELLPKIQRLQATVPLLSGTELEV